jgi:hypothetical protein
MAIINRRQEDILNRLNKKRIYLYLSMYGHNVSTNHEKDLNFLENEKYYIALMEAQVNNNFMHLKDANDGRAYR